MQIEKIATPKGELSRCFLTPAEAIQNVSDFTDVIMSCPTQTIILRKDDITPDFFDLKTKIAGDCLQKVSNYHKRLAILGDFSGLASKSLRDFIFESNRYGQVVFADTLDAAIDLLQ